jgi:hypothetical protein
MMLAQPLAPWGRERPCHRRAAKQPDEFSAASTDPILPVWERILARIGQELPARGERPRGRRTAEQREELASSEVEHGLLPGTRCASLPQAHDAPEAPAGPWGGPESF